MAIVVIGAIFKQNAGHTPYGDKKRMSRRMRKYLAGDYGELEVQNGQQNRSDSWGQQGEEEEDRSYKAWT